jgi:uncharacterized protein (AIM24 family)
LVKKIKYIDFKLSFDIINKKFIGGSMKILKETELDSYEYDYDMLNGEAIYVETGKKLYSAEGVKTKTIFNGGNIFAGIFKFLSGNSMFLNKFVATKEEGKISIVPNEKGKVVELNVEEGDICLYNEKAKFLIDDIKKESNYGLKRINFCTDNKFVSYKGDGKVSFNFTKDIIKKEVTEDDKIEVNTNFFMLGTGNIKIKCKKTKGLFNRWFGKVGKYNLIIQGTGIVWLNPTKIDL